ncbi:uncharacterized protein FIESC28_08616 [Fusarium coffeatum]|uniref:Uncharacterized protein n=1 Tax=Fusarium coffeatum TaxID=231269 RepID=A0A366R6I6_9HYPO|nr:uncharacterized protein FIESC28_08616 [Fusarium coffeatum]RBR12492.1 hypothetical protein FIESC28_08616 [Fusarium coffeatum]
MSVRRSSRLAKTEATAAIEPEPELDQPPSPPQPKQNNKRKAAVSDSGPKAKVAKKTIKAASTASKRKATTQARDIPKIDRLSNLSPEMFAIVFNNIKDKATLNRLGKTCKTYYSLTAPVLYERISVAAMFHAHIAKAIRTLEPHLSIKQRKQLKKEGTYRGQKDLYPTDLKPDETPVCAEYVQQLIVGVVKAGRKHDYIVHRYIEEAMKNMKNVQVFEALCLTESMAQSLAGYKKLQALSLDIEHLDYHPLRKIKNLQHLVISAGYQTDTVRSLLLNSRSKLKTLDVSSDCFDFFDKWDQVIKSKDQKHYLPCLKSLTLSSYGYEFDPKHIQALLKAIDFVRLQELVIKSLPDGLPVLFRELTGLFSTATSGSGVHLRSLDLDMGDRGWGTSDSQKQETTDAKCEFLSSFNTLKTLKFDDYGQYKLEVTENPELPSHLLQAILRHQDLEKLSISYGGVTSGYQLPYLKPATVATLLDNLPHLKEIDIAPEEKDLDGLAEAVSRGSNLEVIEFSCTESWAKSYLYDSEDPTKPLLHAVLKGFLAKANVRDDEKFWWEDHSKVRRVTVNCEIYEVASKFGKGGKGISKPEKFTLPEYPQREVMFRNVTRLQPTTLHVGFNPHFTWVEKVSKDLD